MLIAIGIYQISLDEKTQQPSFNNLQTVPPIKTGFHTFDGLANFREHTLQKLDLSNDYDCNVISVDGRAEYHYTKKTSDGLLIVIASKTMIDCSRERPELYRLQRNIELAYRYPERTRTSLQDILENMPGYIGRDILLDGIQASAQETMETALEALDKLIERYGKLELLQERTAALEKTTKTFKIKTEELNRWQCCW